ncbi:MAG: hypothetical protein ABR551_00280 [Gemmatimonadales bacterium]
MRHLTNSRGWTLGLGVAAFLGACTPGEPIVSRAVDSVLISADCYTDGTVATALSPWVRGVPIGGSIEWVLRPSAAGAVDSFRVTPKTGEGRWPYVNTGPMHGRPDVPAQARGMRPNVQVGHRASYDVTLYCRPEGSSESFTIIIDPDVVVDRARSQEQ